MIDWVAKSLERRFDRQPCRPGILYECMCLLIGHGEVNAAEELLSLGRIRTECRLVSADINCIVNVALCFGHGFLLDPKPVADARIELRSSSSVVMPSNSLKNVSRLALTGLNGNQKRLTFNHRCLHDILP
jgi:hypothetical protein